MVAAVIQSLTERKKVRTDGRQTLGDVAAYVCGDVRLAALLSDMNPALPRSLKLPAGTVVVCPSKAEAQAFAKRMGFQLGFDPEAPNGSYARKRWQRHIGPSPIRSPVNAVALAKSLLQRGVTPAECGRRLAKQVCGEAELASLLAAAEPGLKQAGAHAEIQLLFPKASSRLAAVRSVLDATLRPGGLVALVEALAKAPTEGHSLLQAAAVAPALRAALVEEAPRVLALLQRARALAAIERGARDATMAKDESAAALRPLVEAIADGVDPLGADRAGCVGLAAEAEALLKHTEMLRGALKQAEDGLARASADVIKAIARGTDGKGALPRPWPLLATVCRDIGALVDAAPATARDAGLGGLLKRRLPLPVSGEGAPIGPKVTVAELQARAAACAKAVDEGDAFAERLARPVAELFGLMRPPPAVDGGTPQARKARRRMAFDHAMAARGEVSGDGIAAIVADVVERAKLGGNLAAARLSTVQLAALVEAARGLTGPLTIARAPMSELGRALVVAAMALDREIAQGLLRATGREAFAAAAARHAGRVLSAASCQIA